MNKQQLASKIWESANKMRSKIEANEYKDYILGFIFYKFLSDKEVDYLMKDGTTKEELKNYIKEEDEETVKYCQQNLGYFISYDNLFSTWIEKGMDFAVGDVSDALNAFDRLINESHKKVFNKIFDTLQTGLSKLGDTSGAQTKAIRELLNLIKVIPMDGRQDYDVLGFIYEYLISNFAANAGKKAGEFYTPHEVSFLMSEIVANHLKDRDKIEIYDPTSGSGSLLINIGKSVSKYIANKDKIKYYAQELKEATYNLTRMNLVMRGILPDNIVTRNGDTLEDDWPYFDESDPSATYHPLYVDAVVSNPPYSQQWNPINKEGDARYARYGLAPKAKADYAFLLHDLYHIKPDGIMTIVLPHGVLFRGGEEEKIRTALIENNNIDAIIGLPANIFFGTGIPTIIMVLKQKRENTDVLIVDASKGFIKVGKNNKLQASDIKKIVDAVVKRENIEKFSRVVSKDEIRANEYNLNIPRYVDSSEEPESWDIYSSMFGGMPNSEIEGLKKYWNAFPNLKQQLFKDINDKYSNIVVEDVRKTIEKNSDIQSFKSQYINAFTSLNGYLKAELVDKMLEVNASRQENEIANNIFDRLANIPLVDKYKAYQLLDNIWQTVSTDLEIIQTEGFEATKQVDPNMVVKKKDGKEEEVQDGYVGHIIPFDLIHSTVLKVQADALKSKEAELNNYENELSEIIDSMTEEEKDKRYLNDDNTEFKTTELNNELKAIFSDIETVQIHCLKRYVDLLDNKASKNEKIDYINNNIENFEDIERSKDNTFSKTNIQKKIKELQLSYSFNEETIEFKLIKASKILDKQKDIKKEIKTDTEKLLAETKTTIENLTDEQVLGFLEEKWIKPLVNSLNELPNTIIKELETKVTELANKYTLTLVDLESQIKESEKSLSLLLDELEGNEYDMKGLEELKNLLRGD